MKEESEKRQNVEWMKEEIVIGASRGYCRGETEAGWGREMGQDLRGELSAAQRKRCQ